MAIARRKPVVLGDIESNLAISGENGELEDIAGGRHFLYYFDNSSDEALNSIKAGLLGFVARYGKTPTIVILSAGYGLKRGQLIAGLTVVPIEGIPPYHFWFGPKPQFFQASFDF